MKAKAYAEEGFVDTHMSTTGSSMEMTKDFASKRKWDNDEADMFHIKVDRFEADNLVMKQLDMAKLQRLMIDGMN